MREIRFKSLSSGSCGNCYFLGSFVGKFCDCAVLIDAGVSPRRLKKELLAEGIETSSIRALLVTHDHIDHVRSLGSFCKQYSFPVWSSPILAEALTHSYVVGSYYPACKRILEDAWTEIVPKRLRVKAFCVPHDASQTLGYAIEIDGYKFVIMTDIGAMTQEAICFARQADTVVIESNYDCEMLRRGPYPLALQNRIRGGNGHLSNDECAEAISAFEHEGLKNVFLCHLSEHNNDPKLAHSCSRLKLDPTIRLVTLPRQTPSPLFTL